MLYCYVILVPDSYTISFIFSVSCLIIIDNVLSFNNQSVNILCCLNSYNISLLYIIIICIFAADCIITDKLTPYMNTTDIQRTSAVKRNAYWYHLMALITVIVWGITFVSTKILLGNGLTPADILFYRFLLAYIAIWFISPRVLWAKSVRDELLFIAAGVCGGSLYFIFENTALQITLASNVSLIICTAPLFTTIFSYLFKGEKLRQNLIYGSCIAFAGVALVVFNGNFILKINPLGDILTVLAAAVWAFYNLILKQLDSRYQVLFITRKVFFYGLLTLLPVFYFTPLSWDISVLLRPVVLYNLLFLGFGASMLCFLMWNMAVKQLGAVRTTNYLYVVPLVTFLTSALVINEVITAVALVGSVLILIGVYLAEREIKPVAK